MNIKFCGFLKENNQVEWTFYESSFPNPSFAVVYKEIFFSLVHLEYARVNV